MYRRYNKIRIHNYFKYANNTILNKKEVKINNKCRPTSVGRNWFNLVITFDINDKRDGVWLTLQCNGTIH